MSHESGMWSKIKTSYHRMNLFHKMILFYIMFFALPVAVASVLIVSDISSRFTEEYREQKAKTIEDEIHAVEVELDAADACMQSIQYNTGMTDYTMSYDFSSGEGAGSWLEYVRPFFRQAQYLYDQYDNIRVWRIVAKDKNDPRNVLNAVDNPDLDLTEVIPYERR
ncbi:MAG: hypothetical protein PUD05_00905 [Lachnospiraceae bacterium]|nr:hypothetical protein [Lachnospiraceae bacterium]